MFQPLQWGFHHIENWYVRHDGRGMDGRLLMVPTEGNLPDELPEISHPLVRRLTRQVGQLAHRLEQLEAEIRDSRSGPYYEE